MKSVLSVLSDQIKSLFFFLSIVIISSCNESALFFVYTLQKILTFSNDIIVTKIFFFEKIKIVYLICYFHEWMEKTRPQVSEIFFTKKMRKSCQSVIYFNNRHLRTSCYFFGKYLSMFFFEIFERIHFWAFWFSKNVEAEKLFIELQLCTGTKIASCNYFCWLSKVTKSTLWHHGTTQFKILLFWPIFHDSPIEKEARNNIDIYLFEKNLVVSSKYLFFKINF